jgi:hypothetical protein
MKVSRFIVGILQKGMFAKEAHGRREGGPGRERFPGISVGGDSKVTEKVKF